MPFLKKKRLIFKTLLQTAMDQLHMHFTQAIHNTVFQVVLGYVELCAGNSDTKFQKLQYRDLCTVCIFLISRCLQMKICMIRLKLFPDESDL